MMGEKLYYVGYAADGPNGRPSLRCETNVDRLSPQQYDVWEIMARNGQVARIRYYADNYRLLPKAVQNRIERP